VRGSRRSAGAGRAVALVEPGEDHRPSGRRDLEPRSRAGDGLRGCLVDRGVGGPRSHRDDSGQDLRELGRLEQGGALAVAGEDEEVAGAGGGDVEELALAFVVELARELVAGGVGGVFVGHGAAVEAGEDHAGEL
jgi:hypothetical protein